MPAQTPEYKQFKKDNTKPYCEKCKGTNTLSLYHPISIYDHPETMLIVGNAYTLCRSCKRIIDKKHKMKVLKPNCEICNSTKQRKVRIISPSIKSSPTKAGNREITICQKCYKEFRNSIKKI